MTTDLKKGDMVRVVDGSWAVCVSKEWNEETKHDIIHPHIGLSTEPFEVVYVIGGDRGVWFRVPHDIFIKSTFSGQVYLHSSNMVKRVEAEWFKGAKRSDRFKIGEEEYILVHSGFSFLSLISISNGNCWKEAIKCKDSLSLTKEEFVRLTGDFKAEEIYATKY